MKLIILKGPAKKGKTKTLLLLNEMFKKKYKEEKISYSYPIEEDIISYYDNVEGRKVGIISEGDDDKNIIENIEKLVNKYPKIDVIFCADRSHRKKENKLEETKFDKCIIYKSYIVSFFREKDDIVIEKYRKTNNEMMAKYLYSIFESEFINKNEV